ncbi:MAG: exodeoxyribonuclease VII large subunit [Ruminococcaceae bacterium]|nr:exodeoxyribonuclease VII large subunit [Oscillospiraceae bacterium]
MEQELKTVSVSALNHYIRRVIEHNGYLKDICVLGELSNCKRHPSGHIYMTLKESDSVLKAVMFRSAAASLRFIPEDGMKVAARGRISVYEPGGIYQLYVEQMSPEGEGSLFAAFEQLKKKLEAEGLFDAGHKKPIPAFPRVVSLVTSDSGAAVRDMIHVLHRRFPLASVKLFPVSVQGEGAAEEIARAIRLLNRDKIGDVILVGRGGGSIEDLWSFNEEVVARAIYDSAIPVISAVGHETDFTIADFVADLRAPTPSAAAELCVPDARALLQQIDAMKNAIQARMHSLLQNNRTKLSRLSGSPAFADFSGRLTDMRQTVDHKQEEARRALALCLEKKRHAFALQVEKLEALSPLSALSRGYAYADLPDGTHVRRCSQLPPGQRFALRLSDGSVLCRAEHEEDAESICQP